jgi:hypothetical protein
VAILLVQGGFLDLEELSKSHLDNLVKQLNTPTYLLATIGFALLLEPSELYQEREASNVSRQKDRVMY